MRWTGSSTRKMRTRQEHYDPGGGGINVARAIARLGGTARACPRVIGPSSRPLLHGTAAFLRFAECCHAGGSFLADIGLAGEEGASLDKALNRFNLDRSNKSANRADGL